MSLNESIIEGTALTWFEELGYAVGHGPQLAPGEPAADCLTFVATGLGVIASLLTMARPQIRETVTPESQIVETASPQLRSPHLDLIFRLSAISPIVLTTNLAAAPPSPTSKISVSFVSLLFPMLGKATQCVAN